MPALSFPLISLDDLKVHLPIRGGNVDHDSKLLNFIRTATIQIEQATRRNFSRQVRTELFSTRANTHRVIDLFANDVSNDEPFQTMGTSVIAREQTLILGGLPVDLAETVVVRYDRKRLFTAADTVVASTAYVIDPDLGRMYLNFPTRRGVNLLQVVYTAGFAVSAPVLSPTTWDLNKKEAGVVLSAGDLTAVMSAGISQLQSVVGVTSAKWRWDIVVDAATTALDIGISNLGTLANFSTRVGSTAGGWAYSSDTGNKVNNGMSVAYGDTFTAGDTVTVWFDRGAGAVWFGKNGVPQGGATVAEIESGDTTNAAFTGIGGTVYAAVSDDAAGSAGVTANFGATTMIANTGFTSGLGTLNTDEQNLSDSIPQDLKQAAVAQSIFLWKKLDAENVASKADRKQGGALVDFAKQSGLTPEASSLLVQYKRLVKGVS